MRLATQCDWPIAVEDIAGACGILKLKSIGNLRGQMIKRLETHPTLVARCYTAVDFLKNLLQQAHAYASRRVSTASAEALAQWHFSSPVGYLLDHNI